MKSTRTLGAVALAGLLAGVGCQPSLDVTNPNQPDQVRALASAEDVKALAISSVNSWYIASTDYEPYDFMMVTSDALTANFGNFGMRFNNLEPRIAYANNSAGNDRGVAESPYNNNYGALGAANDAIKAFKGGVKLTAGQAETDKFMRLAQFTQAAALSNLALIFDKAFIVDETTDLTAPNTLAPYKDVSAAAVAKWAALATAEAGKTDTYDPSVFPMTVGPLTSSRIARIANTMAALTMAYTPRNAAEANAVDWAKVKTFAANGIGTGSAGAGFDVVVIGDFNTWYSDMIDVGAAESWCRVDLRLIHRMDPNTPSKMTTTTPPPEGTSLDARFTSDYDYVTPIPGDPNRGIYMLSPYYHKRYTDHSVDSPTEEATPAPYLLAAESDLVYAEALVRTSGDLTLAAQLINTTRVGRGSLAPASAADGAATLLSYIDYERDVELLNTSGFTLFQRRHVDGLQIGTPRHLPVPAKELETLQLPNYTFGGAGKEQSVGEVLSLSAQASRSPFGSMTASLAMPSGGTMDLHFPALPTRRHASAPR